MGEGSEPGFTGLREKKNKDFRDQTWGKEASSMCHHPVQESHCKVQGVSCTSCESVSTTRWLDPETCTVTSSSHISTAHESVWDPKG